MAIALTDLALLEQSNQSLTIHLHQTRNSWPWEIQKGMEEDSEGVKEEKKRQREDKWSGSRTLHEKENLRRGLQKFRPLTPVIAYRAPTVALYYWCLLVHHNPGAAKSH